MDNNKSLSRWLLASDIDGTLNNKVRQLPKRNEDAIKRFVDQGGRFTLASGRNPQSMEKHFRRLPIAGTPAVVINGAGLYDFSKNEMIWFSPMSDEAMDLAIKAARKFPLVDVIIVAKDTCFALSTNQKDSNRAAVEIQKNNDDTWIINKDVQIIILEQGSVDGTFAFYVGDGYLYAPSSSSNQLKTRAEINEYGSWKINIANNTTSIVASANVRNVMQYNPNTANKSPLFACYSTASQKAIEIYKITITIPHECNDEITINSEEATCEKEGHTEGKKCSVCGEVTVVPQSISKLPHTEVVDEAVDATCIATGLTEGSHCDVCNEIIVAQQIISMTNHTTENGVCDTCGQTIGGTGEPEIPAETTVSMDIFANKGNLANKVITWTKDDVTVSNAQGSSTSAIRTDDSDHHRVYKSSTLTIAVPNDATITKIVITCISGYVNGISTGAHNAGYTVETNGTLVTITVSGKNEIKFTASEQGRITNVEVTYTTTGGSEGGETEHTHSYNDVVTAPTCTEDGYTTYTCSCGHEYTDNVVVATGHSYEGGTCSVCGEEDPDHNEGDATVDTLAEFTFGSNGSAAHVDGNDYGTSKSFTSGTYTLALTGMSKVYGPAYDAKGNSCIKLGTSSKAGSFSFTVPENVTEVVIYVAKYKSNSATVKVNETSYTLTKASNNGEYDIITIDTTTTKTVTFTVSSGYRCMINTIVFNGTAQ